MLNSYAEYLGYEYKKAVKNFEDAKAEAVRSLEGMQSFMAEQYGAGYASHIDKISVHAAKVQALAEAIKAYEHFSGKKVNIED